MLLFPGMKFRIFITLFFSLAYPGAVSELQSAPARFQDPSLASQYDEDLPSIARESGDEKETVAKLSEPAPASTTLSKTELQQERGGETKSKADETEPEQQESSTEIAENKPGKNRRQKDIRHITITEALTNPESVDENVDVGSETIEWVGKDRRIKRKKKSTATIYLKTQKPSGKLMITDDYHKSTTDLLGISNIRQYGARPDEAKWLYSGNKFNCELRHPIPGFGHAVMKQGIQEPLQFLVETDGLTGGSGQARIQSMPPRWMRFTHTKDLGVVAVDPKDRVLFTLTNEWVKRLMLELKDGMVPTISFWDEDTGGDDVVLTLSSFNFTKHLPDFSKCLGELLPYSFRDVEKRTVYFGYDKYTLTDKQRIRLNKLIEYVKLDEEVRKINITGFSDSVGFSRYNRTLAQRRANAVKKYLQARGLPAKKLVVSAKGEKDKRHSNRTETGRRLNRRVEVTLIK